MLQFVFNAKRPRHYTRRALSGRKPRTNRVRNAPSFDAVSMFHEPLYDKNGHYVPIEGSVWELPSVSAGVNHRLNWGRLSWVPVEIAASFVQFMRYNVSTKSSSHCSNAFGALVKLSKAFDPKGDGEVGSVVLRHLAALRSSGEEWRFHYARDWYTWCCDQHLPGFDDVEFLYELLALRVPGNKKGEAVLSEDPEEGPLDDFEFVALRAALLRDNGHILERTLTWTLLALGCNPKNLVHLQESDVKAIVEGDHSFNTLNVPRIKKGMEPRAQLKTRKINAFLARLFEKLIERNRSLGVSAGYSRPLFSRQTPRQDCFGTAIEEWAYHYTSTDLAVLLREYVNGLGVISHRTGSTLRITPRRLRYTFATRKVQEGCSTEMLADLLDHSDLQNVMVYYSGAIMTKRLDEALAVALGPIVKRFMGNVVESERDAFNGGGKIKAEPMGKIKNIGTCGSRSLCTLFPPFSCYLCPAFQPWKDAPHREVLEDLLLQKDARIEATGRRDDRIANQYDEIILAVGEVVALCEGIQ